MNAPAPDPLLLCIDMQAAFLRVIPEAAAVQRRCALALATARGLNLAIGFTEQVPAKLGATVSELRAVVPESAVWAKDTFSAFDLPEVRAAAQTPGQRPLLICGIETPVCIYQTTLAALRAGHAVTLLSDAVGARRADDARACLADLARRGASVLPVETVFYARLGSVQHPFFKAYTQLVKTHG